MWVRRTSDKFSLLTVGNITYSGDPRIKVTFQYPNNWRLHINPMLKEDAGLYMCQVSTHPPRVFATNVTVLRKCFFSSLLSFCCYYIFELYSICLCIYVNLEFNTVCYFTHEELFLNDVWIIQV